MSPSDAKAEEEQWNCTKSVAQGWFSHTRSPLWREQWFTNHLMSKPSAGNRVSQCLQIRVWAVRWRLFLCGRDWSSNPVSHQHTLLLGCIIHRDPSIIYVTLHRILSHASFTQKPPVSAVRITLIRVDVTLTRLQVCMWRLRPAQTVAVWAGWASAGPCQPSFGQSLMSTV